MRASGGCGFIRNVLKICALFWFAATICIAGEDLVLNDLEGMSRRPLEPGEKLGSVLVFYSHDCPISKSYVPEINRLLAQYTNFAFYVVEVGSDATSEMAKKHAREYDLRAMMVLDPKHQLVNAVGGEVTPEAVVVGRSGQLLYRGRIDNWYAALGKKRARATRQDLREALDSVARGKPVREKETKAIGCVIETH